MAETVRESERYRVELERYRVDRLGRSHGIYRVVRQRTATIADIVVFECANRDKAVGVLEYLEEQP